MVLSNVGAAELFAIFSTSARFSAIADSMAGLKNSTFTRSKRGTPPYGPFHSARSGLGSAGIATALTAAELTIMVVGRSARTNPDDPIAKASKRMRVTESRIIVTSSFWIEALQTTALLGGGLVYWEGRTVVQQVE